MATHIKDIPYWEIFLGLFPNKIAAFDAQNENAISDSDWWRIARIHRDMLLTSSDWTQLPDAQINENMMSMWMSYRQALRDIPQIYENPRDIVFPDHP